MVAIICQSIDIPSRALLICMRSSTSFQYTSVILDLTNPCHSQKRVSMGVIAGGCTTNHNTVRGHLCRTGSKGYGGEYLNNVPSVRVKVGHRNDAVPSRGANMNPLEIFLVAAFDLLFSHFHTVRAGTLCLGLRAGAGSLDRQCQSRAIEGERTVRAGLTLDKRHELTASDPGGIASMISALSTKVLRMALEIFIVPG
jgi:hypothetical protein